MILSCRPFWGDGGMVDAEDLKSSGRKVVRVRVPLAPFTSCHSTVLMLHFQRSTTFLATARICLQRGFSFEYA